MSDQQPPTQEPPFEYQKWVHELRRHDAQRAHDKLDDFHEYVNKAAMQTAELTLRAAMLINGGAAVALLTFVGDLPKDQKHAIANTLVWFAGGVTLAVTGIGLAYLTNYFMAGVANSQTRISSHPFVQDGPTTGWQRKLNIAFHFAALVAGAGSILCFVWGVVEVRNALTQLG